MSDHHPLQRCSKAGERGPILLCFSFILCYEVHDGRILRAVIPAVHGCRLDNTPSFPVRMSESPRNGRFHIAVTLSRQLGSGGFHVGCLVSRELGFRYVDREVLSRAANYLGTSEERIEGIEERPSGLFERILEAFTLGTPEAVGLPLLKPPVYERDLFDLECGIIRGIVDRCDAVIVGRGGFYALRDHPRVVRVFLHAPRDFRVRRIMEKLNLSSFDEAAAVVDESDRNRSRFIRDMTGFHWSDARNYHLSIDTGTIDFETCTGMIVNVVRKLG